LTLTSGCATVPALSAGSNRIAAADSPGRNAAADQARRSALPDVPAFDVTRPQEIAAVAPAKSQPVAVAPAAAGTPPATSTPATGTASALKPLQAPTPFAWMRSGKSAGARPFMTARIGDDGYRTLVVGSVGGDDPLAIELVDQLARRLHQDNLILGGFDCTVIRTLNPDGEANRKTVNQAGQYVNGAFPQSSGKLPPVVLPEVSFLLSRMQELQPQRVVHVRTVNADRGLIASSSSCRSVADEAASWIGFGQLAWPERSKPGMLEHYIATSGSSDIITFAIPARTPREELWSRYGDTLLNLLLGDDLATREIARQQGDETSADRRHRSPGK
jgi:hypothetical protein